MLETVMLDDEFDVYMAEMTADKRFLFQIFMISLLLGYHVKLILRQKYYLL